jgi:vancomycin resistance protein YoaR
MKKTKILLTSFIVIALVAVGIAAARINYINSKVKEWDNLIYPGVKIEDVELSGKTKAEAISELTLNYSNKVVKKKVNIITPDKTYVVDYSKLKAEYNISKVVDEAFTYGKDLKLFDKYKIINNPVDKSYKLKFNFDSKPIADVIKVVEKDINQDAVNAKITMYSSGKFTVTPDKKGKKLNTDKLKKDFINSINGNLGGSVDIQAPIDVVTAARTQAMLASINSKISTFDTDFSTSPANRANNIQLATKAINGTLMMPGDSFSFNGVVGERTAAKGYQTAPVIIDNKLDSGLGGGICQVSTTLYNTLLRANIRATERNSHSQPSHYIGLGMDATVDYGNLDLKFKNTLAYPIFIEGYTLNGIVYFNMYSNSSLTNRTYDVVSEKYEQISATTKYVDDATLPIGTEQTVQIPYDGIKAHVYLNTYEKGNLISHTLIYNDAYQLVTGLVKKGTKPKS